MIEKDWLFSSDEYICDLRTVGVLVKNNRVLVQRDKNGSEYALPGGRITRILQTMPLFSSFHFAQLIGPVDKKGIGAESGGFQLRFSTYARSKG